MKSVPLICIHLNRYFFKRLRFLGNKTVSHFSTLMFLALWHGYYPGYFGSFMLEFFVMRAEKEVSTDLELPTVS